MNRATLRRKYEKETGGHWKKFNSKATPTIEYCKWVENELLQVKNNACLGGVSQRKTKSKIKLHYVNGRTQTPRDLDFHITPVLTLGISDKNEIGDIGKAWGICIEWGHWAIGFAVYTAYVG